MTDKFISNAVIARLPRYYRYLRVLDEANVERISSSELSRIMNVTASQIRQDLNTFGGFGQQGYGYNVKYLLAEIKKILNVDCTHNMVIIGAGNMARSFVHYRGFTDSGFKPVGIFDNDPILKGSRLHSIPIMMMDELKEFAATNSVDIAILTVPSESAVEAAQSVIDAGIKGIWNFTKEDLELSDQLSVPKDVHIQNVHLIDSLMQLSFMLTENN